MEGHELQMRKKYPRLSAEVIMEHDVMNEDELKIAEVKLSMGESGGKGSEVEQPEHNPGPTPPAPCHSDSLKNKQETPQAEDVPNSKLTPTKSQMDRMIGEDYTLSLHLLALSIREGIAQGKLPTDEQRACLRLFDDLKRSYDYTKKFEEYIKSNPSALIRPGSMGGPGTQSLRNLESQVRKSAKKDGRKSSTPPAPPPGVGFQLPA